ncbi:hypothetical protein [Noviherbaspirillum sp. ST9]|uniref:hypothetical protein n=1 Tax=Noviherbaspirillum sp. ST9 TaxID=3401606 RepID=UPI003B587821
MKHRHHLPARLLLLVLLLCGSVPGGEDGRRDAHAKRAQFRPAAVVPVLGIRG